MREYQAEGRPIAAALPASTPRTRRRVGFMMELAPKGSSWASAIPPRKQALVSLTSEPFGYLTPPHQSERVPFRPADRSRRPEANARQRDAPSGAKLFGMTS